MVRLPFLGDGPAFRVYDTEGNLVHPDDARPDEAMVSLSHAGVDLHLDSEADVALVQFKAQRPEDSRGEYYHLEVHGEDATSLVEATRKAIRQLRLEGWETSPDGSALPIIDELPTIEEARMDELTARALQRVCEEEGVAFRVGSAQAGLQIPKRLARNGSQPPSVTVTDNPNFTTDSGLVLYPSGNGGTDGIGFANPSDRKRVDAKQTEIRAELEDELEDELEARIAQALSPHRGPQRLQAIATLTTLMHGEAREESKASQTASQTVSPVVEVLETAEEIAPEMRDELEGKGRDVLAQELKAHVGEADGYAWWWMLVAFLVGIGVTIGGWWVWNTWSWSVGVPFL